MGEKNQNIEGKIQLSTIDLELSVLGSILIDNEETVR